MYSIIIQIFVDISRVITIYYINYNKYPTLLSKFIPNKKIKGSKIISDFMNDLLLLLSFGLSSPILCVWICFGVIVSEKCWLVIIGKILYNSLHGDSENYQITKNNEKSKLKNYYYNNLLSIN